MRLFAIFAFAACSLITVRAADEHPFDGAWDTIYSCENNSGALGFSYRFDSIVKDNVLHGEQGKKGKPGWFELDGKIEADGGARFYGDGLVGAKEYAAGRRPAGTRYGFHVDARFTGDTGTGKRVEGRPCTIEFKRTHQQ